MAAAIASLIAAWLVNPGCELPGSVQAAFARAGSAHAAASPIAIPRPALLTLRTPPIYRGRPDRLGAVNARLELADWRHRVAELYLTAAGEGAEAVAEFRRGRDKLFGTHPASALSPEQWARFDGLDYFDFNADARVDCELLPHPDGGSIEIDSGGEDGVIAYSRIGLLRTPWGELTLFWTEGYGGNLFLPFRDATAPDETYGAGRYLTDAIKGTFGGGLEFELEEEADPPALTLDFNYAYNPSCAYNHRWACPLAPPENRLEQPIRAGERRYPDAV